MIRTVRGREGKLRRGPGDRGLALAACVMLALSSACGGCYFKNVISPADLDNANVVAHGSVVSETQLPGDNEITDTFQVDSLWKGSDFPRSVTYRIVPCEPASEGVLVLTKAQADMARATGHIDADMRAYDTWSVLDAEPLSFRLSHDPRVWFVIGALAVMVGVVSVAVVVLVVVLKSLGRDRSGKTYNPPPPPPS
jgi:hypothetical protein